MSTRSLQLELTRIDQAFKRLEERRSAVLRRLEISSSRERSPTNLLSFPGPTGITVTRTTSGDWPRGTVTDAEDDIP